MIKVSASCHFPEFAFCTQSPLIYCILVVCFDSCIEQTHPCLTQLFELWEAGDGLRINSVMLHTFSALPLYPWENWRSGFHLGLKNTVINTAVSVSAPLTLPWLQIAARLFTWRTKKSFHPQPRKLYLTCILHRLISEKVYDQMLLKCISS